MDVSQCEDYVLVLLFVKHVSAPPHKARAIKQGMLQELLTGRIRIV